MHAACGSGVSEHVRSPLPGVSRNLFCYGYLEVRLDWSVFSFALAQNT